MHPLLLSNFPKRVIDVFPVVKVLDVDISVQTSLFESEPLFEPVVGGIAKGVDPGQVEIARVLQLRELEIERRIRLAACVAPFHGDIQRHRNAIGSDGVQKMPEVEIAVS